MGFYDFSRGLLPARRSMNSWKSGFERHPLRCITRGAREPAASAWQVGILRVLDPRAEYRSLWDREALGAAAWARACSRSWTRSPARRSSASPACSAGGQSRTRPSGDTPEREGSKPAPTLGRGTPPPATRSDRRGRRRTQVCRDGADCVTTRPQPTPAVARKQSA
jgi:hypothetical protein